MISAFSNYINKLNNISFLIETSKLYTLFPAILEFEPFYIWL